MGIVLMGMSGFVSPGTKSRWCNWQAAKDSKCRLIPQSSTVRYGSQTQSKAWRMSSIADL